MKFVLDRNFSENYQSIVVDIHCEGRWVSRRYVWVDKDIDSFIQSYLDDCKIENISAFGVSEWWVVDSDGMPITMQFSTIFDAKEYLKNFKTGLMLLLLNRKVIKGVCDYTAKVFRWEQIKMPKVWWID